MEKGYLNKLSESEISNLSREGLADYQEGLEDQLDESETEEIKEMYNGQLISTNSLNEYFSEETLNSLYGWYANAIERRDRDPLEEERFDYHFFEHGSFDQTFAYGDEKEGFLLGVSKFGAFIPTHFAPKTMRGGYELIKRLGSADMPAIMAITPDLVKTIDKFDNWHTLDLSFLQSFRNDLMEKQFVYNDHPDIQKILAAFYMEYMNEHYIEKVPKTTSQDKT